MARKTTTISLLGDRALVKAIKAVAATRGLEAGEFVTEALMAYAGDELQDFRASFFNQSDSKNYQSMVNVTEKEASPA